MQCINTIYQREWVMRNPNLQNSHRKIYWNRFCCENETYVMRRLIRRSSPYKSTLVDELV